MGSGPVLLSKLHCELLMLVTSCVKWRGSSIYLLVHYLIMHIGKTVSRKRGREGVLEEEEDLLVQYLLNMATLGYLFQEPGAIEAKSCYNGVR